MDLNGWDFVLWIHLLAMAVFVGGQLFLGLAVVPTFIAQGGSDGGASTWMSLWRCTTRPTGMPARPPGALTPRWAAGARTTMPS